MARWMKKRTAGILLSIWIALVLLPPSIEAQTYGTRLGNVQRGGKVSFEPTGPGVLFDALDPTVRRWYVPQELYSEYQWKQWEYTNYARENYQRYVSTSLEGNFFYDLYGNFVTRGWLIYDWQEINPEPFGSTLTKTSLFGRWFNNLVVASDHKGQYHYAITVGNEIRTTLTPMTFSKPLFNGIQWDFATDKYEATLLLSRISDPNSFMVGGTARQLTDNTNLAGGRLTLQVGDFVKMGGTFINAHHSYTRAEAFSDDLFKGDLLGVQNEEPIGLIYVRIRDDSPEDGTGGGALFASDILVESISGEQTRGSEIGFRPYIEGGFQRRGYLSADGSEEIVLTFNFSDPTYTGPDPSQIRRATIELVLANDYLVDMSSDRQTALNGGRVYSPLARAAGNVQDGSNQRVLSFDYGLPTANQIAGFTMEVTDLDGLEGYLEYNINHSYRKYPNPRLTMHSAASTRAEAWTANLSKQAYPFFAYAEAFNVDAHYSTSLDVVDENGAIDYSRELQRYEFVEDNDDQDRRPDWKRKGWSFGDLEIFPGWDENNDFVSDFNQNDNEISPNRIPDYDEPFLRFRTDRPEFLYGIDMNHNGTIDRFENDEEADLPYRRNQKGFNAYSGVYLHPDVRITVGWLRARQKAAAGRNHALYALATIDHSAARWGRIQLFQDLRKVRDNIADDLLQWLQPPNSRGDLFPVLDELPARDTVVNTTWMSWQVEPLAGLRVKHTIKYQRYDQLANSQQLALGGLRRSAFFLGAVNQAEYQLSLRGLSIAPGWKSEFIHRAPVLRGRPREEEWSQFFMLLMRLPVMRRSTLEGGIEYEIFSQLRNPRPPGAEDSFNGLVAAVQLNNVSEYLGYKLTTLAGLQVTRRRFEIEGTQTNTRGFMTVFAGVE